MTFGIASPVSFMIAATVYGGLTSARSSHPDRHALADIPIGQHVEFGPRFGRPPLKNWLPPAFRVRENSSLTPRLSRLKKGIEVGKTKVGKGCKFELVTDANRIPIDVATSGAKVAESELSGPALQANPQAV